MESLALLELRKIHKTGKMGKITTTVNSLLNDKTTQ
jgi:hypothetical protein